MPELRRWRQEDQKFMSSLTPYVPKFEDGPGLMEPCLKEHCMQVGVHLCLGFPRKYLELIL